MLDFLSKSIEKLQNQNKLLDEAKVNAEITGNKLSSEIAQKEKLIDQIADQNIELQSAVAEKTRIQSRLEHMALYDETTHLPNRNLLKKEAFKIIETAKRKNYNCAVMFLDLNGFKLVNDNNSHEVSDIVLLETAMRLSDSVRDVDIVGRFGGDEFVILLPDCGSQSDIDAISSRIIASVNQPFESVTINERVGVSIGVALYPSDSENYEQLLKYSDTAMYKAKESGKSMHVYY